MESSSRLGCAPPTGHAGGVTRLALDDDLYERLGVAPAASTAEITAAFRARAKVMHPDLHPDDATAADRFKSLTRAYDVLTRPDDRAAYDRRRTETAARGRNAAAPSASGHQPIFRTLRSARTALWSGVLLFVLGIGGCALLASVDTGDAAKAITLWLVVVKLVICGLFLWIAGAWRASRLSSSIGRSR